MKPLNDFFPKTIVHRLLLMLALAFGAVAVILFCNFRGSGLLPSTEFKINKAVYTCSDEQGNIFLVDNECRRVSCISQDGQVQYIISDIPFKGIGFVTDIIASADGGCYVQYLFQNTESYTTKFESICKYNSQGKFEKEVYRIDYQNSENPPHRNNRIFGMTLIDNELLLMLKEIDGIHFVSLNPNTNTAVENDRLEGENVSFMHLFERYISNDEYIFTTADGGVGRGKIGGEEKIIAKFDYDINNGGVQPYYIDGDAENIYINDIDNGSIIKVNNDGTHQEIMGANSAAFDGWCGYFDFSDGKITAVSENQLLLIDSDGNCQSLGPILPKAPILYVPSYIAIVCAVAAAVCLIFYFIYFFKFKVKLRLSIFVKQVIVIIPIIIIMLAISLNYVRGAVFDMLMENMEDSVIAFTVLNSDKFNGDEIQTLTGYDSLKTEAFYNMRSTLQGVLNDNKDTWNEAYYTAIYLLRGSDMHLLAISNDSYPNFSYYDTIDESCDEWNAFNRGQSFVSTYSDFEGDWVYAQAPIYNSKGEIVAVFETGADLNAYKIMTENLISETTGKFLIFFPILIICIVVVALFTVNQLRKTRYAVEEIANGNFDVRISGLSRDEIGDIGRGVNTMAEKLMASFNNSEQLKNTYFKFVPIQFMQLLEKESISDINLGDAVCTDITVLFFDIRAFSKKSEMMTTSENFTFVNAITETAGPIIRKHDGFVDKYIGDAVMALFTDAQSAVDAGIELYKSLVLDESAFKFGGEEIRIGIGIHSGMSMLGIIGEKERLSSTVISNTVNLASRLESLTKQYNTGMIISKDTMDRLNDADKYNLRFLGMVQVAGVNEVKALYEVLDCLEEDEMIARSATKDIFENGVKKFHLGNYEGALKCFNQVRQSNPNDKCIGKYAALAESNIQSGGNDSSVIRFTQK